MKIFNLYDTEGVEITDPALKTNINLDVKLVLKSKGRDREKFARNKVNIIERLVRNLMGPGHRGKKHKIMTKIAGKYDKTMKSVISALKIIEEKTKKNPIQILVKAIENSSPRDEVTSIEYGGARYPQAVDISPTRRISLALRHLTQGAFDKSFNKKTKIPEALAQELMLAAEGSMDSFAVKKKTDTEKQADSAR
ncbi:MAG: 30S ribosomal protein S7 [archaeon]